MDRIILTSNNIFSKDGIQLQIDTSGINMEEFNSNPQMLFNHEYDKTIGYWENIEINDTDITALPNFDEDTDSIIIKDKFERGSLNCASIGIQPLEGYINENDVLVVTSSILYEASIVAIPANPKAKRIKNKLNNMVTYGKNKEIINMKDFKNKIELSGKPTDELPIEEMKCEDKTIEAALPVEEIPSEPVAPVSPEEVVGDSIEMLNSVIEKLKMLLTEQEAIVTEQSKEINEMKLSIESNLIEKKTSLINEAIKLNKITPDAISTYIELSIEQLTNIFNTITPKHISLSAELNKGFNKDTKTYEWYLKNDKEGLKKLSKENISLYKQIEKEYLNK